MSEHTKGELVAVHWACHAATTLRIEDVTVAECSGLGRTASDCERDARRLAACWNAFAIGDIPTDAIEEVDGSEIIVGKYVQACKDRDELLVSLKDMLDWLDDGNRQLSDAACVDVLKARATVAKVEGPKGGKS